MKDAFHPTSDSHSSSPRPERSPAPSEDPRGLSTAPSKNPSQLSGIEAVSHPAPEATDPSGSRVLDVNPRIVEPNAQNVLDLRPSIHDKLKEARNTVWAGLEVALHVLEQSSDVFPPLKSAVGGLNACIQIVKVKQECVLIAVCDN